MTVGAGLDIQENVPLSPLTTIGLGGRARFFVSCTTADTIRQALQFAHEHHVPVHVLGGGSNTVFADQGFPGLVLQVALRGVTQVARGTNVELTVAAGEVWDEVVQRAVAAGLAGIECLSGIPGLVGATPMQNVGAYGQEVARVVTSVRVLDRRSLREVMMTAAECAFRYRGSRFKYEDADRYIVTAVTLRLTPHGQPTLVYPDISAAVGGADGLAHLAAGAPQLEAVRAAVLNVRRRKSMVLDPHDPHTRSCGSFFVNPVLSEAQLAALRQQWLESGHTDELPQFPAAGGVKVPAAWFVEHAGFGRGQRSGGVGISANHPLALVNYGGTTQELLALATEIQTRVFDIFGVKLELEPVVVAA